MILTRSAFTSFIAGAVFAHGAALAAESSGDYAQDLGRVYGAYQRLLAMKEACDSAVPATRAANGKAFAAWQAQYRPLVQELQRRVTAMIRLASKDEQDYTRNVGKYEGAILEERLEYKELLIGLGAEELGQQCRRWPTYLKSSEADFGKTYAAELTTIRKRK
jgi:hypothetical protein